MDPGLVQLAAAWNAYNAVVLMSALRPVLLASGDVLGGIVLGLLGRGADPAQAACWATYLHLTAGHRLTERIGTVGFLAGELLTERPASATNAPHRTADPSSTTSPASAMWSKAFGQRETELGSGRGPRCVPPTLLCRSRSARLARSRSAGF